MIRRTVHVTGCRFSLFGLLVALGLGCSSAPRAPDPSDPDSGRQLLKEALEAWKRGDSYDAYKQTVPSVTVIEPAWKSGSKLIDFEIATESEFAGYDVRLKVTLNQQDASGSPKKQKALYNVCTTPAKVVKRAEGSW